MGALFGLLAAAGGLLIVLEPRNLAHDLLPARREVARQARAALADLLSLVVPYLGPTFVRAYRVLDLRPPAVLAQAGIGFGVAALFGLALLGPKGVPVGLAGLAYPVITLPVQADARRRRIVAQVPDLALYLRLFLSLGYPMPRALGAASAYVSEPLRGELDRLLTRLATERDPGPLVRELAERVGHPDVTLFWESVLAGWTSAAPVQVLQGIAQSMDRMREAAVQERTNRLPSTLQGLIAMAFVDAALLWAVPFVLSLGPKLSLVSHF